MATTLLLSSVLLALSSSGLAGIQTEAQCSSNFSWMNNQLGQSPCLVAAFLLAQCGPDNSWDVPAINLTQNPPLVYSAPSATNPNILNVCGCSWGVYNLMEACIACQSGTQHTRSWSSWQSGCTADLLSNSFYPKEPFKINSATAVPFWATTNPANWPNNVFSLVQARNTATDDNRDVTSVNSVNKHKSVSAGAIAGGVIAAIVVVVLIALSVLYVLLRRKRNQGAAPQLMSNGPKLTHMASSAGFSTRSRPFSPVFSDIVSPATTNAPGPLPFAVPPSSEGGWSAAAPSSLGMYAPDPLILQPIAQHPTHGHSNSDTSMSSGTVVPMQVERSAKEVSQAGHSPQSSTSVVPVPPSTPRGPGRYNPPPYSPTAVTASSGLLPPHSGLPGAIRQELPRPPVGAHVPPAGLQLVTPHDHHAESTFPPEKGQRI